VNSSRIYFKIREDIVKSWKEYEILSYLQGNKLFSVVSCMLYKTGDPEPKTCYHSQYYQYQHFHILHWISKLQIPTGKSEGRLMMRVNTMDKGKKHCFEGA